MSRVYPAEVPATAKSVTMNKEGFMVFCPNSMSLVEDLIASGGL